MKRKRIYLLVTLLVLYKFVFNVFTASFLTNYFIKNYTTLQAEHNWKKFSLFFGLEVENIKLHSNEVFDNKPLLLADRIALRYNLLSVFLAKLQISEIAFQNPRIYWIEKKGTNNFSQILKNPSKEEKEEKKEEESIPKESISTYIPVKAVLHFYLENLEFYFQRDKSPLEVELKGFSTDIELETQRRSEIPLSLEILEIPKHLRLQINPQKKIYFKWNSIEYTLNDSLELFLALQKEKEDMPIYSSSLNLKISNWQPKSPKYKPKSLDLSLRYDLTYDADKEKIDLQELAFDFQKKEWISLKGELVGEFSKNPKFLLESKKWDMQLDEISGFLKSYPGLFNLPIGGNLKIEKLKAEGVWKDISTELIAKGNNIYFQNHSVSYLQLDSHFSLDLSNSIHADKELKIPFINELYVRNTKLAYNGAEANLQLDYNREQNTNLNLGLKNFRIEQFTKVVKGSIGANLSLKGEIISKLNGNLQLLWNQMRFPVGEKDSIPSHLDGNLAVGLILGKNFIPKQIQIGSLILNYWNPARIKSVGLKASGNISSLSPFVLNANSLYLDINFTNLMGSLPYSMLDSIASARNIVGNQISLQSSIHLEAGESTKIKGTLKPNLPGLHLTDLEILLGVIINTDGQGSIALNQFQFKAFNSILTGKINGNLQKGLKNPSVGGFTPNLQLDLGLKSADMNRLNSNVFFKGEAGLNLKVKNSTASGKLFSTNTSLSLFLGKCPGELCKNYIITSMNFSLPIEHDLTLKNTESIVEADKSKYIKSYGTDLPVNFTINRVTGTHPYYRDQPVIYIKEIGDTPGFQARMDYVKNIFTLDKLKVNSLNGTIFGKNILFNLGGGDPAVMEFTSTLQIRDLDFKELLPERRAKSIDDGKIAADLNLSGRNFTDLIPNLNLYFSIFKIGKDFGNSVINIVSPPNFLRDFVIKSYSIDKIEVELSRGLVYANIDFKTSVLSTILTKIEDNRISQERMPLANFLNRAQEEISIYR